MGVHPEALPPAKRVEDGLGKLVARIRALEARLSAIPVTAFPAVPATTTSSTPTDLWTLLDSSPDGWTVTITLRTTLTDSASKAVVQLIDSTGAQVDWAPAAGNVTLSSSSSGPFTVRGYTPTGTLSTWLTSASAAPLRATTDASS